MRLSETGELELLAELEQRGLIAGVEHDAATLRDGLVVTQDALVEGVHFRLDWIGWTDLGWRAAAVNLSDLAASGAEPEGLLVTLAAPPSTRVADVVALYEGIAETGVPVVGGDTTSAEALVISVTAIGRSDRVPGRAGALPGDQLVVSGALGAAGAAFRAGGYVRPPLRLAEVVAVAPEDSRTSSNRPACRRQSGQSAHNYQHALLRSWEQVSSARTPGMKPSVAL